MGGERDGVRRTLAGDELVRRHAVKSLDLAALAETARGGSLRQPGVAKRRIGLSEHVNDNRDVAPHLRRRAGNLQRIRHVRSDGARGVHAYEARTYRATPHGPRSAERLDEPRLHRLAKGGAQDGIRRTLAVVAHEDARLCGVYSAQREAQRKRLRRARRRPEAAKPVMPDDHA